MTQIFNLIQINIQRFVNKLHKIAKQTTCKNYNCFLPKQVVMSEDYHLPTIQSKSSLTLIQQVKLLSYLHECLIGPALETWLQQVYIVTNYSLGWDSSNEEVHLDEEVNEWVDYMKHLILSKNSFFQVHPVESTADYSILTILAKAVGKFLEVKWSVDSYSCLGSWDTVNCSPFRVLNE